MKLNHTPLGALASKKKVVAGAAALALVGGIAPALVNATHAVEPGLAVAEPTMPSTLYTTVGPYYFTSTPIPNFYDVYDDDLTIYVEDTSVADFYNGSYSNGSPKVIEKKTTLEDMTLSGTELSKGKALLPGPGMYIDAYDCEDSRYLCLQGKKVGETRIVIRRDGEAPKYVTLKSGKLSPKAYTILASGTSITETASIEGIDDELLQIGNAYGRNVSITAKGDRQFTLTSSNFGTTMSRTSAELVWTLGNQLVGGGTYYSFLPIEAEDKISGLEENEHKIANSTASMIETIYEHADDLAYYFMNGEDIYNFSVNDGSIVNIYNSAMNGGIEKEVTWKSSSSNSKNATSPEPFLGGNYAVELVAKDTKLAEVTKDELASKLPGKVKGVKFNTLEANIYLLRYMDHAVAAEELVTIVGRTRAAGSLEAADLDDYGVEKIKYADFSKLGNAVAVSIDVSSDEPVAKGYTRKYYVAVQGSNGTVTTVDNVVYDKKSGKLSFYASDLGNYVYGYVDTKTAPSVPNTGAAPVNTVATAAATILPLIALAGVAMIVRTKKHADKKLAKKFNNFE
jgi:hypothetical protein